jgi:hypothetical protein
MTLKELKLNDKIINEDGIIFRKVQEPAKFIIIDHDLDFDGWRINDVHNFNADKDLTWIAEEKIWFAD